MIRSTFACLVVVAALLAVPAVAIAACSSAGVSQYCDPLAPAGSPGSCTCNGAHASGGGGSAGGSGSGATAASANGSAGGSGSGASGRNGSNLSEAAAARSHVKSGLPATGVSIISMLGFGVALLASGAALRQVAGETSR